jgi:5-methyltetrahydrofolate--homocysteine methyltransferase
MQMEYKTDWEETKIRYLAWWAHEDIGRPLISVTAPRVDISDEPSSKSKIYNRYDINTLKLSRMGFEPNILSKPVGISERYTKDSILDKSKPLDPDGILNYWIDLDYIAARNYYTMEHTFYGGEAFPVWTTVWPYPYHMSVPFFLGCPIDLGWYAGWLNPIVAGNGLEDVFKLKIDKTDNWWQFTLKALRRAAGESAGRCIPSIGAIGGCGDTLAALRGTERLLFDVIERPEEVIAAENYLMDMWFDVYEEFYNILHDVSEGSTCFFELWSPGKFYAVHNDFAYMISPKMFCDIFLPIIERQTAFLDHSIYHVDGEGNFAHVPALCELPNLQTLQIGPGEGKPSALHYMDILKYVQNKKKNLWIHLLPEEIEAALANLSTKGLFINTYCNTEKEARDLLGNIGRWSRVKP